MMKSQLIRFQREPHGAVLRPVARRDPGTPGAGAGWGGPGGRHRIGAAEGLRETQRRHAMVSAAGPKLAANSLIASDIYLGVLLCSLL